MGGSYWSEIKLEVPVNLGELIAEIFQEEGAGGVVYDDPAIIEKAVLEQDEFFGKEVVVPEGFGVRVYFPVDDRLGERLIRLKSRIQEILGYEPLFEIKQVQEEDWAEAWKSYFKPEHIGNVVIKPSWEEYFPARHELVIELDPGMAFGTGTHPTTRLCIGLLQEVVTPETAMLDVGTGSGILALTGMKLGAKKVVATDIDPLAVKVAQANMERNHLSGVIEVFESNLFERPLTHKFNLVVANIITHAILKIIPELDKVLQIEGIFLASGIIEERYPEVAKSLEENSFSISKLLMEDGWVGLVAKRKA